MSDDSNSSDEKSLSWTLIGAILVVGLIVAMGVVLSINGLRGDEGAQTTPSPTSSSSSAAADSGSVCGLPGHESSGTLTKAPDATWSLIDGFAVPSTKDSGPGKVEADGFRYCYARTPEGVVLAAANFMGVGSIPELHSKIAEKLIAPGPGQEAARDSAPASSSGSSSSEMRVQIAGFQLNSYTDDEANLALLIRGANGNYISQQFDMEWAKGDWRVALADDGTAKSEPRPVPDATGFVPWSGA